MLSQAVFYTKKDNGDIYLGGLVINPRFQGQGIAREAMTFVLEEFRDVKGLTL